MGMGVSVKRWEIRALTTCRRNDDPRSTVPVGRGFVLPEGEAHGSHGEVGFLRAMLGTGDSSDRGKGDHE